MKLPRLVPLCFALALLPAFAAAQSVEPKNTVITSDGPAEMVSTDKETTITFRDHVVATGTNMKLSCDYLEVIVIRGGDVTATVGKLEKFKSMIATGNVRIIQGDREAACGRAEVLPGEEKVVLSENPVVVDHDQNSGRPTRMAGDEITMLRGQRRLIVKKPVVVGPEIKDLGVDKEAKPETPPAVPATAPATTPPAVAPKQP